MKYTHTISLLLFSGLLTGCVTHLSQQQCHNMDWYQVGYTDADQGKPKRDLSGAIQDCAKFNLTVNTKDYDKGWSKGARAYCTTDHAYRLGVDGKTYSPICPADLSDAFESTWRRGLRKYCVPETGYNLGRNGKNFPTFCAPNQVNKFRNAYSRGRKIFNSIQTIQAQINAMNSQINDLNHQIGEKQRHVNKLNDQLYSGTDAQGNSLTREQRLSMGSEIYDFNHQMTQIRDQIGDLQAQRASLQEQANVYNQR